MQLIILPLAKTQIDNIYEYYLSYNEITAHEIIAEIEHTLRILLTNPYAGKTELSLPHKKYSFRSLPVYKGIYKIIYHCDVDTLSIFAIWNCRQNPAKLLNILEI